MKLETKTELSQCGCKKQCRCFIFPSVIQAALFYSFLSDIKAITTSFQTHCAIHNLSYTSNWKLTQKLEWQLFAVNLKKMLWWKHFEPNFPYKKYPQKYLFTFVLSYYSALGLKLIFFKSLTFLNLIPKFRLI